MVTLWLLTGALVLVALAALGVFLRAVQALPGVVSPVTFYAVLTLHGTGMAGVSLAMTAAIYWYLMRRWVPMSTGVMVLAYAAVLAGLALLAGAAAGRYGSGWTMLYPLPDVPGPGPGWGPLAAAAFMAGFGLLVGAFALWAADFLRAGLQTFGGLGPLLGLDLLWGPASRSRIGPATRPAIVAGTVVCVDGLIGIVPGTIPIASMLAKLVDPGIQLDPLVAKNLLFFAGHILANAPMYLGAGIAYELLPQYAGRSWPAGRVLVWGWLATLGLVMLATFHHLYMDFAEPPALEVLGNVASYGAAFPPIVVTIFSGLSLVYRSGLRWAPTPTLLVLAMASWAIGGYSVVIDSSPWVNQFLHNTLWIVGGFHALQGLGVVFFILAGAYHIAPRLRGGTSDRGRPLRAVLVVTVAGWGAVVTWLLAGAAGQPRRYPYTLPGAEWLAWLGAVFAAVAVAAAVALVVDLLRLMGEPGEVAARARF